MGSQEAPTAPARSASTRRTLLKTAAIGAAGAQAQWLADPASATAAVTSSPPLQVGSSYQVTKEGGLSAARLERLREIMAAGPTSMPSARRRSTAANRCNATRSSASRP
jgi:hypothetical protein